MDQTELTSPFIFYLSLDDQLSKSFYHFDQLFKEHGYILVPVKMDQLQTLAASSEQNQLIVLSSVTNSYEYKIFNEKVRGLLKYVLKSKRLNFLQLSSFSKLNDSRMFSLQKNYYFMKYPLDGRRLVDRIVNFHIEKNEQRTMWPGGKRSSVVGNV